MEKKTNHRGYILSNKSTNRYFIVNELFNDVHTKVFSAVKFDKENKLDDGKFCIRYISKQLIKELLFKNDSDEKISKYYEKLEDSYNEHKKVINHINLQNLHDLIQDDEGIYIVFEFCDWTLRDYVQLLREPNRNNSMYQFEKKFRDVILQILETIYEMHEKHSQHFCGLINSTDIMITELNDVNSQGITIKVKLPHPFLTNIMTKMKILSNDSFPNFFPPEIYKLFVEEKGKIIEASNSSKLQTYMNQNFDMWAAGFLIYEILLDDCPIKINNLHESKNINQDTEFSIKPYDISFVSLRFIDTSLKYEPYNRLQTDELIEIIDEMNKDKDDIEKFGNDLRKRMSMKDKKMNQNPFNLDRQIYHEYKD